jgi:cellulose synthase A
MFLKRVCAYDHQMRELAELGGCNRPPKSSSSCTQSSGTLAGEGKVSFVDLSPESLEKHCRPISNVMMETGVKGTLVERLDHLEERVLKVSTVERCLSAIN